MLRGQQTSSAHLLLSQLQETNKYHPKEPLQPEQEQHQLALHTWLRITHLLDRVQVVEDVTVQVELKVAVDVQHSTTESRRVRISQSRMTDMPRPRRNRKTTNLPMPHHQSMWLL